jgi:NAD(P)H-dependent FMN reductase
MTGSPVLAICGSRKPAPESGGRSAARELLRTVCHGMTLAGTTPDWLDLRELALPLFDGRMPEQYGSPDLTRAMADVAAAETLVLSVPAYWGGPAGVVKNFLDVLGGPAYDAPPGTPLPLAGKVAALLVVGADPVSGPAALGAMRMTLASMGAWVAPRAEVVGDLRAVRSVAPLLERLKDFGAYVGGLGAPRRVTS